MTLRLGKLPDRTPVRFTIAVEPALAEALSHYAQIYEQTHGRSEKPETLIPAMLDLFLSSDSGFKRARRALQSAKNGD